MAVTQKKPLLSWFIKGILQLQTRAGVESRTHVKTWSEKYLVTGWNREGKPEQNPHEMAATGNRESFVTKK